MDQASRQGIHYERSETTEHGMSQMRYSPYSLVECGPSRGLEGRLFGLVLRSQALIVSGYVKHAIGQRLPKDFGRVVWGLRRRDRRCVGTLIEIWLSFDGCRLDGSRSQHQHLVSSLSGKRIDESENDEVAAMESD